MSKPSNSINWRSDAHSLVKYQFLYHFLPHPEHKRRATLLLNKSLFIYCFFVLFIGLAFRLAPVYIPGILGYASNINTGDLLKYTNQRRQEAGLGSLQMNSTLSLAAQRKAEHMFAHGYWAHIAPDGTEPWDFILGANYDYSFAGENLAKNFSNSKDVVNAWYNSPSHKQNLLNSKYKDMGFAVVNGVLDGYETTIVVQMFGTPRAVAVPINQPVFQKESLEIAAEESPVQKISAEVVEQPIVYQEVTVDPVFDVRRATKILSALMAGFILILLSMDLWYSKKAGIIKINGNTLGHMAVLVFLIISIWFVLRPGAVL